MTTTGNMGLDALADAIAERVLARMNDSKPARLMTVEQAAVYVGRTPRAMRHLIATKSIPVVREGRSVHFERDALDRWVELRQTKG